MKKVIKSLSVLFAVILAVSVFAFAAEAEEEKTYIVYPTVSFLADDNPAGFTVVDEETLNMMLEEGLVDWYEENIKGYLLDDSTSSETIPYDDIYLETSEIDGKVYEGYVKYELEVIKAAEAWKKNYYGAGIKVAVVDSGIYQEHPELKGKIVGGQDYTTEDTDKQTIEDTFSHGTQVAGMIVAAHNGLWVKGIAPDVQIVALKVTNDGEVYTAQVSEAIRDAVDVYGCDVINLSLGFSSDGETLKNAIDYAVGKGVTVVAAAGNYKAPEGTVVDTKYEYIEDSGIEIIKDDSMLYPAAYDNVIGVGSVHRLYGLHERADRISPISKQNSSVHITAPGERVITTNLEAKNYITYAYGTSLAAPLVAGAVALLKEANPNLTPAEIMNILAESAVDDPQKDGYDTAYGYGVLDVAAALDLVLNENRAPSTVTYSVTAENTDLNGAVTVADYTTGNIGSHPLGESFTATAKTTCKTEDGTEYKFAYWANGNGTHVSGKSTYTFTATSNFTLRAVYDKVAADESAETEKVVEFWNGNGILLDTVTADETTGIVTSAPADKAVMTGFTFANRWLNEDESIFDMTQALEKTRTRVVADFTVKDGVYSIIFDDNTETDKTENGKYGETVEYTATGAGFDYWKLGNKIISYDKKINIALWGAGKTITAVYNDDTAEKKPTVVLDKGADDASFLIYSVPDGYTITDAGIVFGTAGSTPRVASFHSKASVKELPNDGFGQFTAQPGDAAHTVARGYLIYKDSSNAIRVIYAD